MSAGRGLLGRGSYHVLFSEAGPCRHGTAAGSIRPGKATAWDENVTTVCAGVAAGMWP